MTRNIVVNGRFLARRVTGVERYGREILRYLGEHVQVEATRSQGWRGHAWEQILLPGKLAQHSILWSPANTGPLLIRNQALTIHDLSPLEHPQWFRTSFTTWYRLFLPILAKRVRTVFAPSEYVKRKIEKRFGIRNVTVTPNGVDHSVFHPGAKQTKADLPGCYLLFVGSIEPRKNLDLLFRAWNEIKNDFREMWLVIAGLSGNVFRPVPLSHEMERVCFLGYVDDQTLAGLYANARLFVLPSQDEGFGLPVLEAMASGTPVIVSDGGALPEVVGGAGMIFKLACHSKGASTATEESRRFPTEMLRHGAASATPQDDMNQLIRALRECLSSDVLRRQLAEKGLTRAKEFSWQTTAEIVWKSLHEI